MSFVFQITNLLGIAEYFANPMATGVNPVVVNKVKIITQSHHCDTNSYFLFYFPSLEATCSNLPSVVDGAISSFGENKIGSQRMVRCFPGYEIVGPAVVHCLPNGQWTSPGFCRQNSCGSTPSLANGLLVGSGNSIGDQRRIVCNPGFNLVGSGSAIFCLDGGSWSEAGQCQPFAPGCGSVPTVVNGRYGSGGDAVGSSRRLYCLTGFEVQGHGQITCRADNTWSQRGSCVRTVSCDDLPTIDHGFVSQFGGNSAGDTRQVSCDTGYEINGNPEITCLPTGRWSPAGTCDLNNQGNVLFSLVYFCYLIFTLTGLSTNCNPNVPEISNGRVGHGVSSRDIICDPGYEISGSYEIRCFPSGQWSTPGSCVPVQPNQALPMLKLVGSNTGHGGEGFVLIRQHDGNWGSISSLDFGFPEAQVVCQSLGFNRSDFQPIILDGNQDVNPSSVSSFPIYLDYVKCDGNETNILQCVNYGPGVKMPDSNSKIAVRCSPKGKKKLRFATFRIFFF